ncbi:hypothetical protein ACFY8C_02425 [Streptomyces flavochromogenes]|uniref:Integrase n=1 Tax=Streptomyces flavochromogenes TaxID=68199 RepID=A0ABW6XIA8_9ACTN
MTGHVQDRWYKTETDADGKERRVRTGRYGIGMLYRARYIGPDGTEKSKSFPDKKKRLAEKWPSTTEADMSRGQYIDPTAGRITFRQYGEKWLASQTTEPTTRTTVGVHLRCMRSRTSALGRSIRSGPNTSGGGSWSWRRPCPSPRTAGSSSPASPRCSPRPWTTSCSPRTRASPARSGRRRQPSLG